MAKLHFRGDAQGRAQVVKLTPANVEVGDIFTVTINRKDISYTATESTVDNVCGGLAAAIGQFESEIPEFAEVSASAPLNADTGLAEYVLITGKDDGTPFTLTTSTTNGTAFAVDVTTLVAGQADQNEIQRVVLAGPPTGGTFTLTFSGQTTGAIAYNASAATVTSSLEALSNIAPGDVVVTKNATGDYSIEFAGAYAGTDVPLLTGSGASLTGGAAVRVATTTNGAAATNEIQDITTENDGSQYYFTLSFTLFTTQTTSLIPYTATAGVVQSRLEALSNIGTGNVTVTRSGSGTAASPYVYRVTFVGALAMAVNTLDPTVYDLSGALSSNQDLVSVAVIQEGSNSGVNEVQTVTLANGPTAGTFTLTFQGQTTAGIAYNATTATVTSALEALSNIGVGDVAVTGSTGGPYTVTFQGALASTDVLQMSGSAASLTGSSVNSSTTQAAVSGQNEQETVVLTGSPTGGTFTLTFNSETTSGIAYNATAAAVQTALEGLATPVPGDFTVTGGPLPDMAVIVEFTGAYAETNVTAITGNAASLTGGGTQSLTKTDVTTPTGPHHWNDPENWSSGSLPTTGDKVYVANLATDILYGLDGITDTFAEFHLMASFTGKFGLKPFNDLGYYEYRQLSADVKATKAFIGESPGGGSPFANINFGSVQTECIVYGTGQPDDTSLPALLVKGTHSSNVVRVFSGSVGIAMLPGEVATVATLQVGYLNDRASDVELVVGPGTTLTTYQGSGGEVTLNLDTADMTSFTSTAGAVTINGAYGVTTTFIVAGDCVVNWNTTGTLGGAPVCADTGYLNFAQDMRTKTITNPIEVYSAESWPNDPFQVVTNLRVDANYSNVLVNNRDLGTNVRVTRGTPA